MRIGIFAAEQQEIENIRQSLQGRKIEKAGLVFYEAEHGTHTVISVCGGIGKVNAAICTQLLISEFGAEAIINTGTAGGLNDSLHIFDLVVSTDAVQHDVDVSVFGYAKGQIAGTASPFWNGNVYPSESRSCGRFCTYQQHDCRPRRFGRPLYCRPCGKAGNYLDV